MGCLAQRGVRKPAVPVHRGRRRRLQHDCPGAAGAVHLCGGRQLINYQNTDYDALFQQAQATADDAEQTELYKQMERNLTEHAANVYIQDLADLVFCGRLEDTSSIPSM